MEAKVQISVDKRQWQTSPLPGQIVLISTLDKEGVPNVAPKSWISAVAFEPAVIGFGCNLKHKTAMNVLETKEFVVNVPSEDLVENVWKTGEAPHEGAEKLQGLGFTLTPSVRVSPPRISECKAHLECVYESDKRYGDEVWIFGKVICVSIDKRALDGSKQERYRYLNPIFFLESESYAVLGDVKTVRLQTS